jgi:hypothetical protein
MSGNFARLTPEKLLFVFAAFMALAAIAGVRDFRARDRLEWVAPVHEVRGDGLPDVTRPPFGLR